MNVYAHMNVNCVRLSRLPAFDRWGCALAPLAKVEFFTTTGEVLLPDLNTRDPICETGADRLLQFPACRKK